MKTQLLMIIAVLASSLLALSERASAEKISQLSCLELGVEQGFCDVTITDQDQQSDDGVLSPDNIAQNLRSVLGVSLYAAPSNALPVEKIHPRAPPISLI